MQEHMLPMTGIAGNLKRCDFFFFFFESRILAGTESTF